MRYQAGSRRVSSPAASGFLVLKPGARDLLRAIQRIEYLGEVARQNAGHRRA